MGKIFAVADMVEAYHGALAKSVRIYYNPVSGKIEPISFDGHHGTADFSDFIILDFLKEKIPHVHGFVRKKYGLKGFY